MACTRGIYTYDMNSIHPETRLYRFKIGRSENIIHRVHQEANETTCTCSPHLSTTTHCFLTPIHDMEKNMETIIFRALNEHRESRKEMFLFSDIEQAKNAIRNAIEGCFQYEECPFTLLGTHFPTTWQRIEKNLILHSACIVEGPKYPYLKSKINTSIADQGRSDRIYELLNRTPKLCQVVAVNRDTNKWRLALSTPILFKTFNGTRYYRLCDFKWDLKKQYISIL